MAKAVTTTIKDSFFDDPFFKASKQKMINNHITYGYTDPSRHFFVNYLPPQFVFPESRPNSMEKCHIFITFPFSFWKKYVL